MALVAEQKGIPSAWNYEHHVYLLDSEKILNQ